MKWQAKWIKPAANMADICPVFTKTFIAAERVKEAKLFVTALGVYEARLNGKRVGDFILAPGWTTYKKRLQYQEYDVTGLLMKYNQLQITVGKGWYRGRLGQESFPPQEELRSQPAGLLLQLEILYEDGTTVICASDETWTCGESNIRFSEIYDGEIYDASILVDAAQAVETFGGPFHTLIQQQGEEIHEQEHLKAARLFRSPKGEVIIDFGQEITGYVEIDISAETGEEIELSHAEVLDQEGNFYTENYRSAKAKYHCICKAGVKNYKPRLTFFGFRYIRVDQFPTGAESAKLEQFQAIVVHSHMKRTGYLSCSSKLMNQLFDNVIWGQKGNFLDIPTDCPQRDERLGWTGDAQVFAKTAALNFNVEKFFAKWLADMAAGQGENGRVGYVVPDILGDGSSAAWGDASVICPWEIYLAYGNPKILASQWECMKNWIDYITSHTMEKYLWVGGNHFGDWLGLDAPSGSYKGSTRDDFIASAFYAYSTSLVIKAGTVLNKDVSKYEELYNNIVAAFQKAYPDYLTQAECVLAVYFKLAPDCQAVADKLADMVMQCGSKLQTGFVGTPYLLHVLSDYGYSELAYSLLLRKEYPSWLYSVTKGATTIWEHWDGIKEDGEFWSSEMNSFNHYAYGAVLDWVYGVAAGIKPVEEFPGYEKVYLSPLPDKRLNWLNASLDTRYGTIRSVWKKEKDAWRYEIETPVDAIVTIAGRSMEIKKGSYIFYSNI